MTRFTFLGTGPTGGIAARGKSRRLESSLLLESNASTILIDVTRDFIRQSRAITSLSAVLVTHGHADALGGLPLLGKWQKIHLASALPLYSLNQTLQIIQKNYETIGMFDFRPVQPFAPFKFSDMQITPLAVNHSLTAGFPTVGYHFEFNHSAQTLVYISDVGSWGKRAENFMKCADILIIDGAMWGKRIKAHLTIQTALPELCRWSNKRLILTHIGRTAPPHDTLVGEVKKICAKATVAHDGLRVVV